MAEPAICCWEPSCGVEYQFWLARSGRGLNGIALMRFADEALFTPNKIRKSCRFHDGNGLLLVGLPRQSSQAYHRDDLLMLPEDKCVPSVIGNECV